MLTNSIEEGGLIEILREKKKKKKKKEKKKQRDQSVKNSKVEGKDEVEWAGQTPVRGQSRAETCVGSVLIIHADRSFNV